MKVTTYTLNADGTIPDFVINGGMFPKSNGNPSPQDWTLVGIVTDETDGEAYTLETLIAYVETYSPEFYDPLYNDSVTAAEFVTYWWQNNVEA